jgi:hypothetical protein
MEALEQILNSDFRTACLDKEWWGGIAPGTGSDILTRREIEGAWQTTPTAVETRSEFRYKIEAAAPQKMARQRR